MLSMVVCQDRHDNVDVEELTVAARTRQSSMAKKSRLIEAVTAG